MKGHCPCQATGLSSHAIARRFEGCLSGGNDHPYDPADLKRCADYCEELGISTERLTERMKDVSPTWAALLVEWDSLVAQMTDEFPSGRAPITCRRMREIRERVRVVSSPAVQTPERPGEATD